MVERCVFCELFASSDAQWIANEEDALAFLPLPETSLTPGHTLVAPRRHCVGVIDAEVADLVATIELVQRVSQAMVAALDATGVNVLNASGRNTGQSVNHLHFHVVPRYSDDGDTSVHWPKVRSDHRVDGDPGALLASSLSAARFRRS